MKRIVLIVTLTAALAFSYLGRAAEPANTSGSNPIDTIRGFYRWYVTALIANQEPIKNRKEMKRFATDRLLREIGKMKQGPDGLDGDYFLDAQDFDDLWAKNITVSNVKVSGNGATAEVLLSGKSEMRRRLKVDLVNEGGTWKIDKVKGLD
jgi:hypothetical protein